MFLGTEIYLHNGKLHAKIYRKETDRQHYLHIKSEHPKSLKDSLPYSQAIRIEQISSNRVDLNNRLEKQLIYRQVIFFMQFKYETSKKPHFKQDAFRLFSLKTVSIVHRSILSAVKIVSANSKGINLKGLHSRCLSTEGGHSI